MVAAGLALTIMYVVMVITVLSQLQQTANFYFLKYLVTLKIFKVPLFEMPGQREIQTARRGREEEKQIHRYTRRERES